MKGSPDRIHSQVRSERPSAVHAEHTASFFLQISSQISLDLVNTTKVEHPATLIRIGNIFHISDRPFRYSQDISCWHGKWGYSTEKNNDSTITTFSSLPLRYCQLLKVFCRSRRTFGHRTPLRKGVQSFLDPFNEQLSFQQHPRNRSS